MSKRKRSILWNFFHQLNDENANCSICNQNLSYKSSISNLKKHLARKHPTVDIMDDLDSYRPSKKTIITKKEIKHDPSSSDNSATTSKLRSYLWNYFSRTDDPTKSTCHLCKKIISAKTTTTNLKKHLERKHPSIEIPTATAGAVIYITSEDVDAANTIDETITIQHQKPPRVSADSHNKTKYDNSLIELFTQDFQPFSIVEDEGFRTFVNTLNPGYFLPTKKVIVNALIPALYNKTYREAERIIEDARSVTVTTDCWKSINAEHFMAVTVHFLTENFDMKSVLLECVSFDDVYNSSGLAAELKRIVEVWGLENRVLLGISDNAAETQEAIRDELNWTHFGCYAHTLNIIVQDGLKIVQPLIVKLRNLVAYFKSNDHLYEQFFDIQKQLGNDPKKFVQDVPTRWIYTFHMIGRALELEEAVCTFITLTDNTDIQNIEPEEWRLLKDIKKVLEPMESVTKIMRRQNFVKISSVIILTKGLERIYTEMQDRVMCPEAQNVAVDFYNGLQNHLGDLENNETLIVSTFLDPRFKNVGFTDDSVRDRAKMNVESLVSKKMSEATTEVTGSHSKEDLESDSTDAFSIWSHFDKKVAAVQHVDTYLSRAVLEVQRYLEDALLERNGDPLTWWREHIYTYPYLTKVAVEYLGTTATSVPCERLFSEQGQIFYDRRSKFSSDKVQELVFLNVNRF